jgi:hypothetical protein
LRVGETRLLLQDCVDAGAMDGGSGKTHLTISGPR